MGNRPTIRRLKAKYRAEIVTIPLEFLEKVLQKIVKTASFLFPLKAATWLLLYSRNIILQINFEEQI